MLTSEHRGAGFIDLTIKLLIAAFVFFVLFINKTSYLAYEPVSVRSIPHLAVDSLSASDALAADARSWRVPSPHAAPVHRRICGSPQPGSCAVHVAARGNQSWKEAGGVGAGGGGGRVQGGAQVLTKYRLCELQATDPLARRF